MVPSAGRQEIVVRRLQPADLGAALEIQADNYPPFLRESAAAFASRLGLGASYCLAAENDGSLVGYLLAHGWESHSPPPVGAVLEAGCHADILFIHDLSVSAAGQGRGLGRRLVEEAIQLASRDGLGEAQLIAVGGAAPFWQRLGFADAALTPALAAKVAAYGPDARWMTRVII